MNEIAVKLTGSDPGAGVRRRRADLQYRIDGGTTTTTIVTRDTATLTVPVNLEGPHVFEYRSIDGVGNAEPFKSVPCASTRSAPTTTPLPGHRLRRRRLVRRPGRGQLPAPATARARASRRPSGATPATRTWQLDHGRRRRDRPLGHERRRVPLDRHRSATSRRPRRSSSRSTPRRPSPRCSLNGARARGDVLRRGPRRVHQRRRRRAAVRPAPSTASTAATGPTYTGAVRRWPATAATGSTSRSWDELGNVERTSPHSSRWTSPVVAPQIRDAADTAGAVDAASGARSRRSRRCRRGC